MAALDTVSIGILFGSLVATPPGLQGRLKAGLRQLRKEIFG
jgi:hypothetical protein